MTTETPTKKEIREYLSRVKKASRELTAYLDAEAHTLDTVRFHDALATWTEELSGCAGEVQNLIEARYLND